LTGSHLLSPWSVWPRTAQSASNRNLPSLTFANPAYFAYSKSETLKSRNGKSVELIWLELRNNTRWHIWSVGWPDEYGGSGWCYAVTTDDACHTRLYPLRTNCGDTGMPIDIAPGKGVPVAVPRDELSRGLAVEARFGFYWERAVGVSHVLWFGNSDLPADIRNGTRFIESIARPQSACGDLRGREPPSVNLPVPTVAPSLPDFLQGPSAPPNPAQARKKN
jgi:hypothetical protein